MHAIARQFDLLRATAVIAIKLRMPGLTDSSQLSELGRARMLRRGPNETDDHYVARLNAWLDAHAYRGGPYALVEEFQRVFEEYDPTVAAKVIIPTGYYVARDAAGDDEHGVDPDFELGDTDTQWNRWWMYVSAETTLDDASDEFIRNLCREWNAMHCDGRGTVVILAEGGHTYGEPGLTYGAAGVEYGEGLTRVITGA